MVSPKRFLGMWSATSIGIGSMLAAGIFSIFGTATVIAGNAVYVAFIIAGGVALLNAYSYSELGVRYSSPGGPVEFIVKGLGNNILSGGLNILLWLTYILGVALYAKGFASYAMTFLPAGSSQIWANLLSSLIIVFFAAINFIGLRMFARSQLLITALKLVLLLMFSIVGLFFIDTGNLSTTKWPPVYDIIYCAGIIFFIFQGFGLISTASRDIKYPGAVLPRAIYLSVLTVLLVSVLTGLTVIGNLSMSEIIQAGDFVIAAASEPFMGSFGFRLLAITALFSTSAGINALLYGGANVSYLLAKHGELPETFETEVWKESREGLFITTAFAVILVNLLELEGIGISGSLFLIVIYLAVNLANLCLLNRSVFSSFVIRITLICNIAFLFFNVYYISQRSVMFLFLFITVIAACFIAEWVYRRYSGRSYTFENQNS
ncbi:MAG: amino acid transporter [Methanolobus sp. T82-4]|nr:MAG: amino acid transporter [Methanolobus sp. T82-4]